MCHEMWNLMNKVVCFKTAMLSLAKCKTTNKMLSYCTVKQAITQVKSQHKLIQIR